MIDPNKDGVDHINIYSKGNTALGQMLSNFSKCPINTRDGKFLSVEGYWYWMSIEPCKEREQLRNCYGFWAKKVGKEILQTKKPAWDDNFEEKILEAIWDKFQKNASLIKEAYKDLPFYHYYNYGGKVIDLTEKYSWMVDGISKMRNELINKK